MPREAGRGFDELSVGEEAVDYFVVTDEKTVAIVTATGDTNPLHLDDTYAEKTIFKGRIAHGILILGFVSEVLGMRLPGPGWAFKRINKIRFARPARPGDHIQVLVKITDKDEEKRSIECSFRCKKFSSEGGQILNGSVTMIDGLGR